MNLTEFLQFLILATNSLDIDHAKFGFPIPVNPGGGGIQYIARIPSLRQTLRTVTHATYLAYQITNHSYWVINGIYVDISKRLYDRG